jgi:hypothetical protein
MPWRHGGRKTVPSCRRCHILKDKTPLTRWPPASLEAVAAGCAGLAIALVLCAKEVIQDDMPLGEVDDAHERLLTDALDDCTTAEARIAVTKIWLQALDRDRRRNPYAHDHGTDDAATTTSPENTGDRPRPHRPRHRRRHHPPNPPARHHHQQAAPQRRPPRRTRLPPGRPARTTRPCQHRHALRDRRRDAAYCHREVESTPHRIVVVAAERSRLLDLTYRDARREGYRTATWRDDILQAFHDHYPSTRARPDIPVWVLTIQPQHDQARFLAYSGSQASRTGPRTEGDEAEFTGPEHDYIRTPTGALDDGEVFDPDPRWTQAGQVRHAGARPWQESARRLGCALRKIN